MEVSVFAVLLLGMLGILTTFLIRGQRFSQQTESYGYAQREATKIIRTLTDDLYRSTHRHIRSASGQIVFLSSRPLEGGTDVAIEFDPGTGQTTWKSWTSYSYDEETRRVLRSRVPLTPATSGLDDPPEPEVAFGDFVSLGTEQKVVGNAVESFRVSREGLEIFTVEVSTRFLGTSKKNATGSRSAEVSLSSTVRLLDQE